MAKLPARTIAVTVEDASLDLLCFEYAYILLGDRRQAGKLTGYVEAALEANPALAQFGPVLPLGTVVNLPEFTITSTTSETVRLWD